MSKERPILFNGAMVRAILSGQKTQTRRVLKQATGPSLSVDMVEDAAGVAELSWLHGNGPGYEVEETTNRVRCPFGQPGDRLWVRETWAHYQTVNSVRRQDGRSFSEASDGFAGYRADGFDTIGDFRDHVRLMSGCDLEAVEINGDRWRPSIHMPRWACRLVLEITAVRVERLQALPEADWEAEGISFCMEDPSTAAGQAFNEAEHYAIAGVSMRGTPEDHGMRAQFAEQSLDWDSNPWVWVIEFKVVAG